MTKTRRREITIETHKVTIIRRHRHGLTGFCPRCGSDRAFVPAEEIEAMLQMDTSKMEALVQGGELHFVEVAEDNRPLLCSGSIEQLKTKNDKENENDKYA